MLLWTGPVPTSVRRIYVVLAFRGRVAVCFGGASGDVGCDCKLNDANFVELAWA